MDNQELAKKLSELVGGKSNIVTCENCMTRLRIEFKDQSLVNIEQIKKTEDVLGVVHGSKEIQIILGPGKVAKVAKCFQNIEDEAETKKLMDEGKWIENKIAHKQKFKFTALQNGLKKISQIFVPLIPGIMASGLLLGVSEIINALKTANVVLDNNPVVLVGAVMALLGQVCFEAITIYVGINSSKVFKCTTILGGMIGCMVMLSGVTELSKTIETFFINNYNLDLHFYNAAVPQNSLLFAGKGGVIGVIMGVWILSKIEHWLRKRIPDTLDLIVTPLVAFLITGLLMLFIIMPVFGCLSDWIASGLNWLATSSVIAVKVVYGFLMGAIYLPLVLFGLHQGLMPLYLMEIANTGYTIMICPQLMAGFAQVGAAICIYIKAKKVGHIDMCKTIAGALPAGLLGIGEPLIYGMSLPLTIVFVSIGLGAGCAGIYIVISGCAATAYGPSALLAIPTMVPSCMLNFCIGALIAVVLGALFTQLIVRKSLILKHKQTLKDTSDGSKSFEDLVRS